MYLMMYANARGELKDHPGLSMLGRSGDEWVVPEREMMLLPRGASLAALPHHVPVGFDEAADIVTGFEHDPENAGEPCYAVGAILPQGFTRTLFPACVKPAHIQMPLLGYAAIGFRKGNIYVAAVQTDKHHKWHPVYYNTEKLPRHIAKLLKKHPRNRILRQLARCSLQYNCFTAQNIFYGRWEGGIPTTNACNAACMACISEDHQGQVASTQKRLDYMPTAREVADIGEHHLHHARDGIISFGQGCEGEPSLSGDLLGEGIHLIRKRTLRGTININTNAGYTTGIKAMCDAGLDSMRVSMFSCRERHYQIYHRPRNYSLQDVEESIAYAKARGVKVALNLLVFPGFTDREEETAALIAFCRSHKIETLQLRNLNIDPEVLFAALPARERGQGIPEFIQQIKTHCKEMQIASYSHPAGRVEA